MLPEDGALTTQYDAAVKAVQKQARQLRMANFVRSLSPAQSAHVMRLLTRVAARFLLPWQASNEAIVAEPAPPATPAPPRTMPPPAGSNNSNAPPVAPGSGLPPSSFSSPTAAAMHAPAGTPITATPASASQSDAALGIFPVSYFAREAPAGMAAVLSIIQNADVPLPDAIKLLLAGNQKVGLIQALWAIGQPSLAMALTDRLPPFLATADPGVTAALFPHLHAAIAPVYARSVGERDPGRLGGLGCSA